jgi:hypothetical protein
MQRTARGRDNAIFDVATTLFLVEDRSDDAGVKQILHFLNMRSEIRGPNSHGPSFCIAFNTRRTSLPQALDFGVGMSFASLVVRRVFARFAVVAVMCTLLTLVQSRLECR